jgi:hypothetical protein
MPSIKEMTPEQAYNRLSELQKRTRERQRKHHRQAKEQGKAKVSIFLSKEASRILNRERGRGRKISDILSDALVEWDRRSMNSIPIRQKPEETPSSSTLKATEGGSIEPKSYDEVKTINRIMELHGQGLSYPKIAQQLEAEGWLSQTDKTHWNTVVLGRIIRSRK